MSFELEIGGGRDGERKAGCAREKEGGLRKDVGERGGSRKDVGKMEKGEGEELGEGRKRRSDDH